MFKRLSDKDIEIRQAKMIRVLQMIILMCGGFQTIQAISDRLDISHRTVYRYLDLLESIGFKLAVNGSMYRIESQSHPDFIEILTNPINYGTETPSRNQQRHQEVC